TVCALAGAANAQSAKADKTASFRELIMVSFPDLRSTTSIRACAGPNCSRCSVTCRAIVHQFGRTASSSGAAHDGLWIKPLIQLPLRRGYAFALRALLRTS